MYSVWSVLMFLYEAVNWKKDALSFFVYAIKVYLFEGWHQLWVNGRIRVPFYSLQVMP